MASTSATANNVSGENHISQILSSVGLGNLLEKFQEERVDVKSMNELNDKELHRLGVTTIGDRVRLREACKKSRSRLLSQQYIHDIFLLTKKGCH